MTLYENANTTTIHRIRPYEDVLISLQVVSGAYSESCEIVIPKRFDISTSEMLLVVPTGSPITRAEDLYALRHNLCVAGSTGDRPGGFGDDSGVTTAVLRSVLPKRQELHRSPTGGSVYISRFGNGPGAIENLGTLPSFVLQFSSLSHMYARMAGAQPEPLDYSLYYNYLTGGPPTTCEAFILHSYGTYLDCGGDPLTRCMENAANSAGPNNPFLRRMPSVSEQAARARSIMTAQGLSEGEDYRFLDLPVLNAGEIAR
jgi:hypothetical protein